MVQWCIFYLFVNWKLFTQLRKNCRNRRVIHIKNDHFYSHKNWLFCRSMAFYYICYFSYLFTRAFLLLNLKLIDQPCKTMFLILWGASKSALFIFTHPKISHYESLFFFTLCRMCVSYEEWGDFPTLLGKKFEFDFSLPGSVKDAKHEIRGNDFLHNQSLY